MPKQDRQTRHHQRNPQALRQRVDQHEEKLLKHLRILHSLKHNNQSIPSAEVIAQLHDDIMDKGPLMTAVVAGVLLGHLLTVLILILCRLCKMKPSNKPENEDSVQLGKKNISKEKVEQRSHQSLMFAPIIADYQNRFSATDVKSRDVTPPHLSFTPALPVLSSVAVTEKHDSPSRFSIKPTSKSAYSTKRAVDNTKQRTSLNQPNVCLNSTEKLTSRTMRKPGGFLRPDMSPQTPPRPPYSQRSVSGLGGAIRQSTMNSVPGRSPLFGPRPSLPGGRISQVDTVAGPRLPPPFLAGINQLRID